MAAREGQLRLTIVRWARRPSCGDMSCHTSCPGTKGSLTCFGGWRVDVEGTKCTAWCRDGPAAVCKPEHMLPQHVIFFQHSRRAVAAS